MNKLSISVLALAVTVNAQELPHKEHAFFDKTNLALFSADALVRSLDAQSTRSFETNNCRCISEKYLPQAIVSSSPKMYSYSLGMTGLVIGAAYVAHKTGHHRIERLVTMVDIAQDGRDVAGNYNLLITKGK